MGARVLAVDDDAGMRRVLKANLQAHGILTSAQESVQAQVLFDPFKKQFNLPASTIELSHCDGWQCKMVGEEH